MEAGARGYPGGMASSSAAGVGDGRLKETAPVGAVQPRPRHQRQRRFRPPEVASPRPGRPRRTGTDAGGKPPIHVPSTRTAKRMEAALEATVSADSVPVTSDETTTTAVVSKPSKEQGQEASRVGGHHWAIEYYPNGYVNADFISFYPFLDISVAKDVKAECKFSILDKDGEPVDSLSCTSSIRTFSSKSSDWGYAMKKTDLERSGHLRDDCFSIRCDVSVLKAMCSEETKVDQFVVVPPSDLHRHLGDLLKSKDGTDVTFQVGGESFSAHRSVLAARSSVFKAELFGTMKDNSKGPIEIRDMEADVFKSLLHFIYTDSLLELPSNGSNEGEEPEDVVMAGHLLVAADRYNIERLKLICERKLCRHSNMVANSLALAEQHSFHGLKEACLQFLVSPSNLEGMKASDGYKHLKSSCPSVLKELVARLLPAELQAAKDIIMEI